MTQERRDPFDQLLDACSQALDFVTVNHQVHQGLATKRADQKRRIERAIAALTGEASKAPGTKRHYSPEASAAIVAGMICKDCGHHHASKAHKEACKGTCSRCKAQMNHDSDPLDPGWSCPMCGNRPRPTPEGIDLEENPGSGRVRPASSNGVRL